MKELFIKIKLDDDSERILEEVIQRQKNIDALQEEIKELMKKILELPLGREAV